MAEAEEEDSLSSSDLEEEEEEEEEEEPVFLGFVTPEEEEEEEEEVGGEETSVIGGVPGWLWDSVSVDETMECVSCHQPLVLFLSLYAPLDSFPQAFHRRLFLFLCPRVACWRASKNSCIRVFRSQRPESAALDHLAVEPTPLCRVCAKPALKSCGQCHKVRYCSKAHQVADWKMGGHKQCCGTDSPDKAFPPDPCFLWSPMLIDTEEEHWKPDRQVLREIADANAAICLPEAQNQLRSKLLPAAATDEEVMEAAKKADSVFLRFLARTKEYPDQVLRYSFGAKRPLWVNSTNQLVGDPPKCERCGANRVFEFQLMPQLLFFLKVDQNEETAMDWSSLIVYSCEQSCPLKPGQLAAEFVFAH